MNIIHIHLRPLRCPIIFLWIAAGEAGGQGTGCLSELTSNTFSAMVSSVHLGILLTMTFFSGCQDNWFARSLVFWTSVSRHQGFLNMAKIEQKGMFAPRFCLSLFPSLSMQGLIQSPYFCQGSVLAYKCTSSTARSVSWCCGVHTLSLQGMRSCGVDLVLHPALLPGQICYLS